MTPEDAILEVLRYQSDTGLGILYHQLRSKGFSLSKAQVGTIVDRLIIERKVRAIEGHKATLYALTERKSEPGRQDGRTPKGDFQPTGLQSALDSLMSRLAAKRNERSILLKKLGAVESEMLDLSQRAYILTEQEGARLKKLAEIKKEDNGSRSDFGFTSVLRGEG